MRNVFVCIMRLRCRLISMRMDAKRTQCTSPQRINSKNEQFQHQKQQQQKENRVFYV